jgi:hypothetical protein
MNTVANIAMEHDKKLRQLFELAEDNQLAVQDAIACLTAEREALARERMVLAKASINSAEVSDTLRKATADAIPAIAAAADKSIQASMERALASAGEANDTYRRAAADASESLRRTATDAVPAIERAADRVIKNSMERALGLTQDAASRIWTGTAAPVVERFSTVTQMAVEMETRIRRAGYRHAWQWTALTALGVVATLVVAVVGVQQLKSQQADLQAQKAAFSEEMARMQASVTFLEKKGGRIHLDKCGPEGRLCFEVTAEQGNGRNNFKGSWFSSDNQKSFVIPKGY